MTHDLFGKLKYKDGDEQWVGRARLPLFAAVGARPPEGPLSADDAKKMLADMNATMEGMRDLLRQQFGDKVDAAFEQWDKEAAEAAEDPFAPATGEEEEELDPREQERERKRHLRAERRAARLAKGLFPVGVGSSAGEKPTATQEATFRFLLAHEKEVFDAVTAEVWDSFTSAYGQEHWRKIAGIKPAAAVADLAGRFALTRVDITREARGGFAHLVVHVDSDWQDEHGLMVVYSPDAREAAWTGWDGLYDLIASDDPADAPEEFVPTPHDELLEAILTGDEAKARDRVAAGADINALGPDEYPPLWIAVDQLEVEEVRRLLAFGADPGLVNEDEKTTPLKHAKALYRDMGFAPSKKRDALLEGILSMAKQAPANPFDEAKRRLDAIIALLEGATGKG